MPKKKKPIENITSHVLVPDHIILTEKEKSDLINNLHIELCQLPKILTSDAVSISIGAESGQVLKIVRKSHTAKEAVAYRFVVEDSK